MLLTVSTYKDSSFFLLKKHNSSLKAFEGMIYIYNIFWFPDNASLPACSVYTHHVCVYTYCMFTCVHGETDNSLKTNRRNENSARQIDSTNTDTKFEILANAVKRDHSCACEHGFLSRKTKKKAELFGSHSLLHIWNSSWKGIWQVGTEATLHEGDVWTSSSSSAEYFKDIRSLTLINSRGPFLFISSAHRLLYW